MQVKTVDATEADKLSARVLFDSLFELRSMYWKDLTTVRVLDAFARNGQLTVSQCVRRPGTSVEAWELGAEHERDLWRKGCQMVWIGCSYKRLEDSLVSPVRKNYDLLVIDTPQGLHSDYRGAIRVEHFDFLRLGLRLLGEGGVVVLYVNTAPYNAKDVGEHGYDKYAEYDFETWMRARRVYYGKAYFDIEDAVQKYRSHVSDLGLTMSLPLVVPCLSDVPGKYPYAYRLAFRVDPK